MQFTRREIAAARDPRCEWSAEDIVEAMERRFPGGGPIEAAELVESWLADKKLPRATLVQCGMLISKLTGIRKGPASSSMLQPRKCLEYIAEALSAA